MPATTYRIFQLPNFSAGTWEQIGPPLQAGTDKLFEVLSHTWNLTQKPTNVRLAQGWIEVVLNNRLDAEMEAHLGITPS